MKVFTNQDDAHVKILSHSSVVTTVPFYSFTQAFSQLTKASMRLKHLIMCVCVYIYIYIYIYHKIRERKVKTLTRN